MRDSILQLIVLSNELLSNHCNLTLHEPNEEYLKTTSPFTDTNGLLFIKSHIYTIERTARIINSKNSTQWSTNTFKDSLARILNNLILQKDIMTKLRINNTPPFAEKFSNILKIMNVTNSLVIYYLYNFLAIEDDMRLKAHLAELFKSSNEKPNLPFAEHLSTQVPSQIVDILRILKTYKLNKVLETLIEELAHVNNDPAVHLLQLFYLSLQFLCSEVVIEFPQKINKNESSLDTSNTGIISLTPNHCNGALFREIFENLFKKTYQASTALP